MDFGGKKLYIFFEFRFYEIIVFSEANTTSIISFYRIRNIVLKKKKPLTWLNFPVKRTGLEKAFSA